MTPSQIYVMDYDPKTERWQVHMNGKCCVMHCGERLEMLIGNYWLTCRIEMDRDWYIVIHETKLDLRKKDKYNIQMK